MTYFSKLNKFIIRYAYDENNNYYANYLGICEFYVD